MQAWLVVVTGVSGAGKTVVGEALASRLGVPYADGDAFHSAASIAKMAAGEPLNEEDRAPWLTRIVQWLQEHREHGGVVSCSALRRRYRDRLASADTQVTFLQLAADPELIRARMIARKDHFMPAALLDSQLAMLEPLEPEEQGLAIEVGTRSPAEVAQLFVERVASEYPHLELLAVDPLDGKLDLHTFRPDEVSDLVREYVLACQAKGVLSLRIVHGKGTGTLRRTVHAVLGAMPEVASFTLAEPVRGGWGATLVELHPVSRLPAR